MTRGANKLGKYKFMNGSEKLKSHLPETKRMKKNTFWNLLDKYKSVIVKPNGGSRGEGIIKVTSLGNSRYVIHSDNKRTVVKGEKLIYANLSKKIGHRNHIVQRWIKLATVKKRPFDIRVIVQRKRNTSKWEVTGEIAKVAGKGFIVTNNTRSKGILLPIKTGILESSIVDRTQETMLSDLHRVALLTAERLNEYYPRQRIFGLDMGLDQSGHVWIIEANKAPSLSHFLKLKDYATYNRIRKYKKS